MAPSSILRTGPIDVLAEYGYVWLPYAIAVLLLVCFVGTVVARTYGHRPVALSRILLTRTALLAVLAGGAGALADAAAESDGLARIDPPIWQFTVDHRTGLLTGVAKVVTTVGSTVSMTVIALAAIGVLVWRRRWDDAVLVGLVCGGAGLIVLLGKKTVGRQRPPVAYRLVTETNESFPSGHSLASMAVLGVIAVLLVPLVATPRARISLGTALALAVLAIGLSRIYLGVHWATDVLGGWVSGAAWLVLCVSVRTVWRYRQAHRRPVGGGPLAPVAGPEPDPDLR